MIAANVAAARALEAKKAPVMYRVHEAPSREKLVALKDYLATFEIEFALGQVIKPGDLQPHHRAASATATRRAEIMEQVLRTQMQARYGPERLGHFGLALATYAHFTSPIRRYADLLVHRALVSAYRLGEGGLPPGEDEKFEADRRADLDARAARDGGRARDRSTAMSRPSSPTRSGSWSSAGSPASSRSASSPRSRIWAATGWCSPRRSAANISATTRPRERWSATRAARPTASASG